MEKRFTKNDAKKWAMAVYAQTQADGFFTATRYGQMIGARWLLNAAKDLGYIKAVKTDKGSRNTWIDEDMPSKKQIESLYDSCSDTKSVSAETIIDRLEIIDAKIDDINTVLREIIRLTSSLL